MTYIKARYRLHPPERKERAFQDQWIKLVFIGSKSVSYTHLDVYQRQAPELQAEAVTADMTAVEQIVYNLADNAAKYACFDGSVLKRCV